MSGRYRSCWLRRHWTGESGACRLPGCGQVPGDVAHLLSAECPALQPHLATILPHLFAMLSPNKDLLSLLASAVSCNDKVTTASFFLDPSTNPKVIALVQRYGKGPVLGPLFRVSRAWIWSAHRARMRLLGLERFLLFWKQLSDHLLNILVILCILCSLPICTSRQYHLYGRRLGNID